MTTLDPQTAPTLALGSDGDWVAYLQGCLSALGHASGVPDGAFGPRTRQAVEAFQQAAGLVADGVVGPRTWAAVVAAFQPPGGGAQPADEPGGGAAGHVLDPARAPLLREGHEGEWVRYLQELLERAGHTPGPVDGIFGPRTEAGVRSFQAANGCDVDGVVGPQTWTALVPVAAAHPTAPPYGTTPSGGGGRPGGAAGGGSATVTTDVYARYDGGTVVWFDFPTTNHGAGTVLVKQIEWSGISGDAQVTDVLEHGEEAGPGATVTTSAGIPGSPDPSGPATITVRAVAVWSAGGGGDQRSAPVAKAFTIHPDGSLTEGPAPRPEPTEPKPPAADDVTCVVSTEPEIDHDSEMLTWHMDVHNGTDQDVYVLANVYSGVSGGTTFSNRNGNSGAIAPGESTRFSDVMPMGASPGAPYQVTITAYAEFTTGGSPDDFRSSATGSISFTIDGEGVVNGTAHGSGGDTPDPSDPGQGTGQPGPILAVSCDATPQLIDNQVLQAWAAVRNIGRGDATAVVLVGGIDGPSSDRSSLEVATLPTEQQAMVNLSVSLPVDRPDALHLILTVHASESYGAEVNHQRPVTVLPDGTVQVG
jgi:peptidoglycan hydrolase-like protein with peptidoglycan-binding domain